MPQAIPAIVVGVVGAATSLIGGMVSAGAARQQAESAQAIANYNAEIARQNNEVTYQMALYQAQYGQMTAQINQQMAMQNAQFAEAQAMGARKAYEQGLENEKQKQLQAQASRLQASEAARREREKNEQTLSSIRSRYAAAGVTQEGSPLVVLADAARLAESTAQDIIYAGDLQSRKELREGEIEKFKAGFSLLDEMGYKVEAGNYQAKAAQFGYQSSLYEYDSAIAGVQKRIGDNQATLIELGGAAQASAYRAQATSSLISGFGGAASSVAGGFATGIRDYGFSQGVTGYKGIT